MAGRVARSPMLPNFLVIGAEKAATTWLYECLKQHPEVFVPDTKEIHFFNRRNSNLEDLDRYNKLGLDWYHEFFKRADSTGVVGEVTPMYLSDADAPERIHNVLPTAKLIAILRNPVDRAYSHYWMARGKHFVDASFDEIVKNRDKRFIERGMYFHQIKRYYDLFDPMQLLILLFDDVNKDARSVLQRVYRFLGVRDDFIPEAPQKKVNPAGRLRSKLLHRSLKFHISSLRGRLRMGWLVDLVKRWGLAAKILKWNTKELNYPPMTADVRKKLTEIYSRDIIELSHLIQRDLTWWLES